MNKEYNFLYVNGDSFSAGHNLANRYLYPKLKIFKEEFSFEDYIKENILKKAEKIIRKNGLDLQEVIKNEKSYTFPSKVYHKIGMDFMNSSRRGASLQEIAFSTILDFENLKKQRDVSNCFAIIFLTSIFRNIMPVDNSFTDDDFTSILPSSLKNTRERNERNYVKYFYEKASQQFHELSSICALNGLNNYFDSNNISYAFFDSFMYSESIENHVLNKSNFVIPDQVIKNWYETNEKILLYCGHFNEKVHEDIAEKIVTDYLKKEYNK